MDSDVFKIAREIKTEQETKTLKRFDFYLGALIGTVEIVDCVPVEDIIHTLTEREKLLRDYSPGDFAWILKNPVMFDDSIPMRGRQGWWNWDEEL